MLLLHSENYMLLYSHAVLVVIHEHELEPEPAESENDLSCCSALVDYDDTSGWVLLHVLYTVVPALLPDVVLAII